MSKNLQQIKKTIGDNISPLRDQFGVQKLGVFGSFTRNEQTDLSDVDILVEFSRTPSLFRFIDLEQTLTSLVGRKVDLVTKNALKPSIKNDILNEVVYV
ncbi:MAG: nucleotidyltransferase family protein [Patescibacteria group bacterium]|nr:nucleotidyltransferase family protein [Patescibacteria group bacterium]MCL5432096.1 nucleotidyltransferase family protein [Patescibacteria group bacterium]